MAIPYADFYCSMISHSLPSAYTCIVSERVTNGNFAVEIEPNVENDSVYYQLFWKSSTEKPINIQLSVSFSLYVAGQVPVHVL